MKRVSSGGGDLRTSGAGQTPHEAAKHITTNMVREAANLVVSSSAIIANHDMRVRRRHRGSGVRYRELRILVSLVSSMDEDAIEGAVKGRQLCNMEAGNRDT
jgi:hypothetical protein